MESNPQFQNTLTYGNESKKKPICKFFLNGNCKKGNQCDHFHPKHPQKFQNQQFPGKSQTMTPSGGNFQQNFQPTYQPNFLNNNNQQNFSQNKPKLCKYGMNCKKINSGCTFVHQPTNDQMDNDQPQSGFSGNFKKGQCQSFSGGKCDRVKCKFLHILPDTDISIKLLNESSLAQQQQIVSLSFINNKQSVVMATSSNNVMLMGVNSQAVEGQLPQDCRISVIKGFDDFPNTVFMGVQKRELVGSKNNLRIVFAENGIETEFAHSEDITDIEYAKINGGAYFFTSSADKSIKAWQVSPDQKKIDKFAEQIFQSAVTALKLTQPAFLVGALASGELVGWDLNKNIVSNFQAHNAPISHLHKHDSFLISGDMQGNVQVRNINQEYSPACADIQSAVQGQIMSLAVINPKNIPLLVAGDMQGFVTVAIINGQIVKKASFGAHNDSKFAKGVAFVYMNDSTTLTTIGVDGYLRNWTIN